MKKKISVRVGNKLYYALPDHVTGGNAIMGEIEGTGAVFVTHDCVYYWSGGSERGEWNLMVPDWPAEPWTRGNAEARTDMLNDAVSEIKRAGRFALKGSVFVGAPEGPPENWNFDRCTDGGNGR
jgi:hypothetical protein